MAQFDVHRNAGKRTRRQFPFVVVVQSGLFSAGDRRVVIPLALRAALPGWFDPKLNPTFVVEGQEVVLSPLDIVSVDLRELGELVTSLRNNGDRIIAAIDWLLTQTGD